MYEIIEIKVFMIFQNFFDILVLFPYKEGTKSLNSIFSKTTPRNFKIFSGMIFLVNTSHFMPKKWG